MIAKEPKALVYRPGEAETLPVGDMNVDFLASGEETDGALSVIQFRIPESGGGTGLHIHMAEHEMGYVLEGTCQFTIGEQTGTLNAGDWIFIPKGTPHKFKSGGQGPFRLLSIFSPAGFEGYFKELSHLLTAASSPPDPSAFAALEQKYHLSILNTGERTK